MKSKIYLGIVILIIGGISMVSSLPVIISAENTEMVIFGITLLIFALLMYASLIIPPILLVNTLLGGKIKLDTGNVELADEYKGMSEEGRNELAWSVMQEMQERLPQSQDENGETRYYINTGKDAVLIKRTLDYIMNKIHPTDDLLLESIESYANYYKYQISRAFVGAKTVMVLMIVVAGLITISAISIATGITMIVGFSIYIAFYYYSAKRPVYLLEKDSREGKQFDSSLISRSIKSIWAPDAYKKIHQDVLIDERTGEELDRSRNYGRELGDSAGNFISKIIATLIASIIALGLTPIYSIYYFCSNYWGNCLSPFKDTDKWVEEQYALLTSEKHNNM